MNKIGGVLLAGGLGSRLFPNTKTTNKHLLPIYDKPMIFYSLSILLLAGIRNITIVCNPKDEFLYRKLLGDGNQFGVEIIYSLQESPQGIPHAVSVALETKLYEKFMLVLGDNFLYGRDFFRNLLPTLNEDFKPKIFYQQVKNPELFGVIKWKDNALQDIVEKPTKYISNDAVIGIYLFDEKFRHYFNNLKKSNRNEYEITDLIKQYKINDIEAEYIGRGTAWFDMGSNDDFFNCSHFVKTIQDRQGLLVCSPYEIAYRHGWIDESSIEESIRNYTNSEYSISLLKSLNIKI